MTVPIYGLNPDDPAYAVRGNNRALYAGRDPLYGEAYWAELWYGPAGATEAGLTAVPGTRVHFRDEISAIRGDSDVRIPGTLGGDVVTVQLRVWESVGPGGIAVTTWEQVLLNPSVARGTSSFAQLVLGNVSAAGKPYIPPSLAFVLEGFSLHLIPEPASAALCLLGACIWAACRPVGRRVTAQPPISQARRRSEPQPAHIP